MGVGVGIEVGVMEEWPGDVAGVVVATAAVQGCESEGAAVRGAVETQSCPTDLRAQQS